MQTTVDRLSPTKVKLTVHVPFKELDHAFEHALSDLSRDVRVPGFRKGKAPAAVIRQRVGEEAVAEEALRSHVDGWWRRACSAEGVENCAVRADVVLSDLTCADLTLMHEKPLGKRCEAGIPEAPSDMFAVEVWKPGQQCNVCLMDSTQREELS